MRRALILLTALFICLGLGAAADGKKSESFLDYGRAVANLGDCIGKSAADADALASRLLIKSKKPMNDLGDFGPVAVVAGPGNRYTAQFKTAREAEECLSRLKGDDNIVYAHQDALVKLYDDESGEEAPPSQKGAALYNSWGAKAMGIGELAAKVKRAGSVTVAIIDSGVGEHPLLDDRVKSGGIDLADTSNKDGHRDTDGHGTHVAGIVADLTRGLNVNIYPVRVLDDKGMGTLSDCANGLFCAAEAGCSVANISLGFSSFTEYNYTVLNDAVDFAVSKGCVPVVAAGNEHTDSSYSSPSSIRDAITVAGLDMNLKAADYSNFGDCVDVAAPGDVIKSCVPGGGFIGMSGTSMASPHVAAVAAIVKLMYPSYSVSRVDKYIKNNCLDLGDEGWDIHYGYGMPYFRTDATQTQDGFSYRRTESGAIITGYEGTDKEITLPETLGGLKVCAVDISAFSANEVIEKVVIPGFLEDLGENAFCDCVNLKSVIFEKGASEIRSSVFKGCVRLTDVTLPDGIERIGDDAFYGCTLLSDATLPDSLKSIGASAFMECESLREIKLPDGVTDIGEYCFSKSGLKSITIPGSVVNPGSSILGDCLEIESVILKPGVSRVSTYMFGGCRNLMSLTLPESVKTIEEWAFSLSGVKNLDMPGVTSIDPNAFVAASLESIEIPEGVTSIPDMLFQACGDLKKVVIPRSVTSIGKNVFGYPEQVTLYIYMDSIAEEYAVVNGINYEIIGFLNPPKYISVSRDTLYTEPERDIAIDDILIYEPISPSGLLNGIKWTSSDPNVCKIEEQFVFFGQRQPVIRILARGESVITGEFIYDSAINTSFKVVSGAVAAREIRLNKAEVTLAPEETYVLTAKVLPETVDQSVIWETGDPEVALIDENGLVTAVSTGQTEIVATVASDSSIHTECIVTVCEKQSQPSDFLYSEHSQGEIEIIRYAGSAKDVEIPASIDGYKVASVGSGAFTDSDITSVKIPEGVRFIGGGAFADCKSLKSVSLPASLLSVSPDAFKGCKKLPKVVKVDFTVTKVEDGYRILPVFTPSDTASAWSMSVSPKKNARVFAGDVVIPKTDDYFKITLKAGGKKAALGFRDALPYAASKVTINGKENRKLMVGKTMALSYKVEPESARVIATWSSDNNSVASVSRDGTVTPIAPGKAVITLETDIGLSDKVVITVKQ